MHHSDNNPKATQNKKNTDSAPLVDAVRRANPSSRLMDWILKADSEHSLPCLSLIDFRRNRQNRVLEFLKAPGMEDDIFAELMTILFDATVEDEEASTDFDYASVFDVPIEKIIATTPCSTRLRNAVSKAAQLDLLPHKSLRQFAQAGSHAVRAYGALPHVGETLMGELEEILNTEITQRATSQSNDIDLRPHSDWHVGYQTIESEEAHWNSRIEELERLDLSGAPYVKSIAFQIGRYWPDRLSSVQIRDFYGKTIDEARDMVGSKLTVPERRVTFHSLLAALDHCIKRRQVLTITEDPKTILEALLDDLTPRENDVITQRYGISDGKAQTLQKIANKFGVTRERIRQIESTALATLKHPLRRGDFGMYLQSCKDETEEVLLGPDRCARVSTVESRRNKLNGMTRLAIDCCHGGNILNYANSRFKFFDGVYFSLESNVISLPEQFEKIEARIGNVSMPMTLNTAASEMSVDPNALCVYATASDNLGIYRECIYSGKLGFRTRRTINIIRIASDYYGSQIISFNALYSTYLDRHPEDQCSDRDLRIVLSAHRHLFVNLTDAGYWIINTYSSLPRKDLTEVRDDLDLYKMPRNRTLQTALVELVEEMGPSPLLEIRDKFIKEYPQWSKNSVFALLSDRPYFVRMAPGVMGTLPMSKSSTDINDYDFLFTKRQVSYFIFAKLSKALFDYPLWMPALEYAWCVWGKDNLQRDLFTSLLSVVSPDSWSVSNREKSHWKKVIGKEARPRILVKPDIPYTKIPTVENCSAVAFFAADKPTMSWMDINRIIGKRIDDRVSLNHILVLSRLGVFDTPESWYMPIPVNSTPAYRFVNEVVSNQLIDSGWKNLKSNFNPEPPKVGWAKKSQLDGLMDGLLRAN